MTDLEKIKLLEAIEAYASFYHIYKTELNKGNLGYVVWQILKNKKFEIIKNLINTENEK
jgi:hypothetical protein